MKILKPISLSLLMLFAMTSLSQCSITQKIQKKAPVEFGEVYAQKWTAGVQGGGSGINVFIPVEDTSIPLDTIFFRSQKVKLEFVNREQTYYVGRFLTDLNQINDLILSSDMKEESRNQLPILKAEMPFEINDNECIISYRKGAKTLYYKISNIKMKESLNYPGNPSNGQ